MIDLQNMVENFVETWAPEAWRDEFIDQLRQLMEAYAKAALRHRSLPDSEHEHGDPL